MRESAVEDRVDIYPEQYFGGRSRAHVWYLERLKPFEEAHEGMSVRENVGRVNFNSFLY